MISMKSVTTILELFFTFNTSADSGSIEFEHSDYSDEYFRWTKNSFNHDVGVNHPYYDGLLPSHHQDRFVSPHEDPKTAV